MLSDGEKGVIIQRDKQSYAVAPHLPCGLVTPAILRKMADVAEKFNVPAMKITSAARIALVGIKEEQVDPIWEDLGLSYGAAVGLCIRSVKACPGTTFCKRGLQDSLGVGIKLDEKYHGMQLPGKFKIGVSGCPNQCAENCIKDVGMVGTGKGWKVTAGGNGGARPRLADELTGPVSEQQALTIMDKVIAFYNEKAEKKHTRLGRLIDEMGLENFKKEIIG